MRRTVHLALLTVALAAPGLAADWPPPGDGPWVVRAHYLHDATLGALPGDLDVWTVEDEKGFVVAAVDADGLRRLAAAGFWLEVDEARTAALNRPNAPLPEQTEGIPGFPCYRTVEETHAAGAALAADHPGLATWTDIGDSWDKATPGDPAGYDLYALRLTSSAVPGPKPALYVGGGIHAREYTSAELATRFAELLVARYGSDPDVTWILDHHEVHLVLQQNPDGRKEAEAGASWRKNTNGTGCATPSLRGIDLNRNFSFAWGACAGSSGSPCSETYRGASPVSEPEAQAIRDYWDLLFGDHRPNTGPTDWTTAIPMSTSGIMLDLHSYGGDVLSPFGCTGGNPPPNGDEVLALGRRIAWFNGYDPRIGSLYSVDGATKDYSFGELGVVGYTIELGTDFFEECAVFEQAIAPQTLPALLYAARTARSPYLLPSGPDATGVATDPRRPFAQGETAGVAATLDDTRAYDPGVTVPSQAIAAAELYLEVPPWGAGAAPAPMAADDGAWDAPVEGATGAVDTTGLAPGRHLVFVRGQDAAGSWGPVGAAFLDVVDPAVAPVLSGRVRDAFSGAPVAATVAVGAWEAPADPGSGDWTLQVPAGSYDLVASAPGYRSETVAGVTVADFGSATFVFSLVPLEAALAEDAEAGVGAWTAQAPWAITATRSHSPTHSWTDSPAGAYGNNALTALTSPVIDLAGLGDVRLAFHHLYDLEPNYDYGIVQVSTNGGASWTEVARYDGYDHDVAWQAVDLAVPALDGVAAARVRFLLDSDGSVTADGWYVDDVVVSGAPPAPLFADGFEHGDDSAWGGPAL